MEIRLRLATYADAPRLHELHSASVRELGAPHYAPEVIEGWLVNRRPEGYVAPIERRGVGAAIMTHALEIARRGHDGPVRVEATLNAAPFYARFGFREVGRSTLRRGAVDVPFVLMEHP
jgi:GNAT superfamily N-acetyltransferase